MMPLDAFGLLTDLSESTPEGEHKQITVLFADMISSMELIADRDPEEAQRLLDPVLGRMMQSVQRYEGTISSVRGDGIMALFGAPFAYEDHAVRACYAALRMQEAVKRYAHEIQRTHGVPIQIRVGLNSGEALVYAIGNDAGLALYLSGHMGPKPTVHMTEQENLFCVVAGPRAPNPPALLGSENMADFLRLMADTHQFVVIDSAPILPVADARVLARAVDGVILVVRAGAAPSPIVKRVTSILESVQAPLLGFVLNGAESLGFRSQYSRYYGD